MLPDGRALVTLRDAATYITELPKEESAAPEWQAANPRCWPDRIHAGAEPAQGSRV